MSRLISPQISIVSKDGNKEAEINRVPAGYGCDVPHYEVTKLKRSVNKYRIKSTFSFKEAISIARKWTGRERVVEYKKEPERSITR